MSIAIGGANPFSIQNLPTHLMLHGDKGKEERTGILERFCKGREKKLRLRRTRQKERERERERESFHIFS